MPHFFLECAAATGDVIPLSAQDAHHAKNALRLEAGADITLADSKGRKWRGRIRTVSSRDVTATVGEEIEQRPRRAELHLGHALLKKDWTELVLQKSVELGVDHFHPYISSRTIVRPKMSAGRFPSEANGESMRIQMGAWGREGSPPTLNRWQKIADEAAKQCGRNRRMTVHDIGSYENLVRDAVGDLKILFWEEETRPLKSFFPSGASEDIKTAWAVIGPEGGFSKEEVAQAQNHGWASLSLGPLVLKAETAAITAVSLVQYELENL